MAVPFLDLSRQYAYLKDELNSAAVRVLAHGAFIHGPELKEFESKIAELCGVRHAVGVASGTDALLLALHAVGVGPGDEVITTDFSFFATAGVVSRLGAKPVFVDIDADSYNIDPSLIERAITNKTKAIMPVHLFGQIADMDSILEIGRKHSIIIIEDAAQSIGAVYKGRVAGSMGDMGCFSFYPTKNLGAAGDAGMITTNDDQLAESLRILRVHGAKPKYYHKLVGYNSRLDTIQAAILMVKLPHLKKWSEQRIAHAKKYDMAFSELQNIKTPAINEFTDFHIYNQYTIAVNNRDEFRAKLSDAKIGSDIYYPVSFHAQECFANLECAPENFPNSIKASNSVLALPIYPELTEKEQDEVIAVIKSIAS